MTSITIGGIVSGLDTTSIIDKLVQVEGNSKTLLTNQQTAQKAAVTAYSSLLSSIGTLATQVSSLADTSTWATTTASSSASSVSATATGANAGSLTFTVGAVATANTLISSETVGSTAASVASSGSLTLQKSDGTSTVIDVGNGTLAEVVAGINGASAGITATAVQTSPGNYRLQVAANSTGNSSQFSLSGIDGFSAMNTLALGSDASITIGSGDNAYDVTSPTNTFTGVANGISFTVSQKETAPVTVSSAIDPSAVATRIAAVVTNMNNLLASITTNTAWDPTSKTGGPLLGDSTVRSLQQTLLTTVSSMNTPGLAVTADGQLSFDAAAFQTAFKANPSAVQSAYGSGSSFTPAASVTASASTVYALPTTVAGSYDLLISANAKAEQWQAVPPGTGIVGRTLTLTRGTSTVNYAVEAGDTSATAASKLNTKLAEAGFGVSATTDSDGHFIFTANTAGAAGAFTVSIDSGTASRVTAGADIQGSIDGVAATGLGNVLTLAPSSSSHAAGLSVAVTASDADIAASGGAIGQISYQPGVAQQLNSLFNQMSDSSTGQLVTAQASITSSIKDLQTQIDGWTSRLDTYRATLTQKFTAMETALSALKTQSTALSQYFNTPSTSSSSGTSSSSSS